MCAARGGIVLREGRAEFFGPLEGEIRKSTSRLASTRAEEPQAIDRNACEDEIAAAPKGPADYSVTQWPQQ